MRFVRVDTLPTDQLCADYKGLLTRTFGLDPAEIPHDLYVIKHQQNPFGPSVGYAAYDGEELVGLRVAWRWEFVCQGETISALQPVDTIVHPDCQGKGVFGRLTKLWMQDIEPNTVIFNYPNDRSYPIYLKYGWKLDESYCNVIYPINYPRILWGLLGGQPLASVKPSSLEDYGLQRLDQEAVSDFLRRYLAASECFVSNWSWAVLQWLSALHQDLRVCCLYEGQAISGMLFFVLSRQAKWNALYLLKTLLIPGQVSRRRLYSQLRNLCAQLNTDLIRAESNATGNHLAAMFPRKTVQGRSRLVLNTTHLLPEKLSRFQSAGCALSRLECDAY